MTAPGVTGAPVDVLADAVARAKLYDGQLSALGQMVADKAIEFHRCRIESLADVVELIEADKEYDEALRLANIGYGSDHEARAAQQRLREAIASRRAALARVQGGAA